MATLKEDSHSWKAHGVIRKDFRSNHGGAWVSGDFRDPEVPKHQRKRKNRKKWCRGKPGREHNVEHIPYPAYGYGPHLDVCITCGKHIKYYWNTLSHIRRELCSGCNQTRPDLTDLFR